MAIVVVALLLLVGLYQMLNLFILYPFIRCAHITMKLVYYIDTTSTHGTVTKVSH